MRTVNCAGEHCVRLYIELDMSCEVNCWFFSLLAREFVAHCLSVCLSVGVCLLRMSRDVDVKLVDSVCACVCVHN